VSVFGTVPRRRALGIISRRHESAIFASQSPMKLPFSTQLSTRISLRASSPRALDRDYQRPALPLLTRHPISISSRRYWTMNQFPIDYAFQPRLRGRLTLGRLPLPRKPRAFGERVSHPSFRYSCRHTPFCPLQRTSRFSFIRCQNAPLPLVQPEGHTSPRLRYLASAPLDLQRITTRPVSCYALFQGMAASKPTSWMSLQ
jgi:hypothetical protein